VGLGRWIGGAWTVEIGFSGGARGSGAVIRGKGLPVSDWLVLGECGVIRIARWGFPEKPTKLMVFAEKSAQTNLVLKSIHKLTYSYRTSQKKTYSYRNC
jgi:hypothetical protein